LIEVHCGRRNEVARSGTAGDFGMRGAMDMVLTALAVAVVTIVVGFVLYSHWHERYGDNHY
jgi:hypothetical protein